MFVTKSSAQSNKLANQAAHTADEAIQATQRAANHALDSLSDGVEDLRHQATPLLNRVTEQASAMAQRGMDSVRDTSHQIREKAQQATDSTANYIKDEPFKAILIAAATGAALMALVSLMGRSRDRG